MTTPSEHFQEFWQQNKDIIGAMTDSLGFIGIDSDAYKDSQSKKIAQLIFMTGYELGTRKALEKNLAQLKETTERLLQCGLSPEEKQFSEHMSEGNPSFLSSQAK